MCLLEYHYIIEVNIYDACLFLLFLVDSVMKYCVLQECPATNSSIYSQMEFSWVFLLCTDEELDFVSLVPLRTVCENHTKNIGKIFDFQTYWITHPFIQFHFLYMYFLFYKQ